MKPSLQVQKLSPTALLPTRASPGAAGYDLFSNEDAVIQPWKHCLVKTGLALAIPVGNYGRVAPRSGLALKFKIDVGAGVIDSDYRGEGYFQFIIQFHNQVGVLLFNFSEEPFKIKYGDRIAQLIIEKISCLEINEVTDLNQTQRGAGGFGSTGTNAMDLQFIPQDKKRLDIELKSKEEIQKEIQQEQESPQQ